MLSVYSQACRDLMRRPLALLLGTSGVVLLIALAWWWLSLPVADVMDLVLLAVVGLVAVALAVCMAWKAFQMWGGGLFRALGHGPFWPALLLAGVFGLLLPWGLVKWVPGVEGLWSQAASMAVRFGLAIVLFTSSLLWLGAVAGVLTRKPVEPGGEAVVAEEPEVRPE